MKIKEIKSHRLTFLTVISNSISETHRLVVGEAGKTAVLAATNFKTAFKHKEKEGVMLTGPVAELVKGVTGLDDQGIAKLHPGAEKLFKNIPRTLKYQTVAEVVKSEHCFAQVKVGDRLVFDPFLNPKKSSGVMCPKALLPVLTQIGAIWEMAIEWADSGKEAPPEIVWNSIRCLDPGLEDGGTGGVVYRIRLEKISP